jgi:hypothetical protein
MGFIHILVILFFILLIAFINAFLFFICLKKTQSRIGSKKFFFKNRGILSILIFLTILSSLWFYRTSYWGDSGFGDQARVPLGFNASINRIDGSYNYFQSKNHSSINFDEIIIDENLLYGVSIKDDLIYFQFDMKTGETIIYKNKNSVSFNNETDNNLYTFYEYYDQYWTFWKSLGLI